MWIIHKSQRFTSGINKYQIKRHLHERKGTRARERFFLFYFIAPRVVAFKHENNVQCSHSNIEKYQSLKDKFKQINWNWTRSNTNSRSTLNLSKWFFCVLFLYCVWNVNKKIFYSIDLFRVPFPSVRHFIISRARSSAITTRCACVSFHWNLLSPSPSRSLSLYLSVFAFFYRPFKIHCKRNWCISHKLFALYGKYFKRIKVNCVSLALSLSHVVCVWAHLN